MAQLMAHGLMHHIANIVDQWGDGMPLIQINVVIVDIPMMMGGNNGTNCTNGIGIIGDWFHCCMVGCIMTIDMPIVIGALGWYKSFAPSHIGASIDYFIGSHIVGDVVMGNNPPYYMNDCLAIDLIASCVAIKNIVKCDDDDSYALWGAIDELHNALMHNMIGVNP